MELVGIISLVLTIYFFWLLSNILARLTEIRDALHASKKAPAPPELRNQPQEIPFTPAPSNGAKVWTSE